MTRGSARKDRRLTPRQLEIIDLLSRPGARQASVAEQLGISPQTVKNHLALAYRTLDVRSLAQAVRIVHNRSGVR
jgi:DNA-binding NarL/FixJ family response regulator